MNSQLGKEVQTEQIDLVYIDSLGNRAEVRAPLGKSLMEVAIENGVPGIDAECGGYCSCGTCHVYLDKVWGQLVNPPTDEEEALIAASSNKREYSRLACQINTTREMDGIIVFTPPEQQ